MAPCVYIWASKSVHFIHFVNISCPRPSLSPRVFISRISWKLMDNYVRFREPVNLDSTLMFCHLRFILCVNGPWHSCCPLTVWVIKADVTGLHRQYRVPDNLTFTKMWNAEGICVPETSKECRAMSLHALNLWSKKKAVPLHAMEALGGRGGIAPTHSRPRH
jgi:hypothetical protein